MCTLPPALPGLVLRILSALSLFATVGPLAAQEPSGRYEVLIPDLLTSGGVDRNVGRNMARFLREGFSDFPTHRAIDRKQIDDQAGDLDMRMHRMDCTLTRQLANRMGAQVALCAEVAPAAGNRLGVTASFWDMGSGTFFTVSPFEVEAGDARGGARRILESFQAYVSQARSSRFCLDYAQSGDRESAMINCDQAIELNPQDTQALLQRARLLMDTESWDRALQDLESLLEVNTIHEEALQLAGYIAIRAGRDELGRSYYRSYLDLQPNAVDVRRRVAYDMFEAGDPRGAMDLVAEGLKIGPNTDLLLDFGNYAFSAATKEGAPEEDRNELLRSAVEAHLQAYEELGDEMSARALRNLLTALVQLSEPTEATRRGELFLQTHPGEVSLWVAVAQARQESGDVSGALEALDQAGTLDPEYPGLAVRRVRWLLDASRQTQAIRAVDAMTLTGDEANQVAQAFFADAHNRGVRNDRWDYALAGMDAARRVDQAAAANLMMRFWQGYVLLRKGQAVQEPQTLESARASLPLLERARELMTGTEAYTRTQPSINLAEYLANVGAFIEIQQAIIKRGGG
ncbi:MAG: hypothetical protein ABIF09_09125 [Gemmatimonadota bacterium]